MSVDLYAKYLKERSGKEIITNEHGFATYLFEQDYVYLEDVYVEPEHRRSNICFSMADEIVEIAKSKGYKKIIGSVVPGTPGATNSLKVLLEYGFKLAYSTESIIYFQKEI